MLVVIAVVIGVAIALYLAWCSTGPFVTYDWDERRNVTRPRSVSNTVRTSLVYSLVGLVVAGFVGVVASLAIYEVTADEVPRRFEIESLGDGSGAEGRFFLGGGTVDTEAVFFYYGHRKGGGYGLFHVDADQTAIYEDQTNSGYLIKYCKDEWTAPGWLWPRPDADERYDCSYAEKFEFHIPENSIDRRFNLDAQ